MILKLSQRLHFLARQNQSKITDRPTSKASKVNASLFENWHLVQLTTEYELLCKRDKGKTAPGS